MLVYVLRIPSGTVVLNEQTVQLLNSKFAHFCAQGHSWKVSTMSHSPLSQRKFSTANYLVICIAGLVIFCVVTEPRISIKSAKFTKTLKVPQNVSTTYLKLILAVGAVYLQVVNLEIYRETSSLQKVNNVQKLPGILRLML